MQARLSALLAAALLVGSNAAAQARVPAGRTFLVADAPIRQGPPVVYQGPGGVTVAIPTVEVAPPRVIVHPDGRVVVVPSATPAPAVQVPPPAPRRLAVYEVREVKRFKGDNGRHRGWFKRGKGKGRAVAGPTGHGHFCHD